MMLRTRHTSIANIYGEDDYNADKDLMRTLGNPAARMRQLTNGAPVNISVDRWFATRRRIFKLKVGREPQYLRHPFTREVIWVEDWRATLHSVTASH